VTSVPLVLAAYATIKMQLSIDLLFSSLQFNAIGMEKLYKTCAYCIFVRPHITINIKLNVKLNDNVQEFLDKHTARAKKMGVLY
jgi:hypothetical protein